MLLCLIVSGCGIIDQLSDAITGFFARIGGADQSASSGTAPEDDPLSHGGADGTGRGSPGADDAGASKKEFRAVWVATVLNLDFPSKQNLSAAAMKREVDAIVARAAEMGLNAIVFQVRPTGDAFYKSDIFPVSHWLSGTQGQGIADFDPLEYWIETCHENGVELHAWINPYRVIHTNMNSSDPNTLAQGNPVRQRPELAVAWSASNGNKGLFLDPGLPESRRLIIDGVTEIIRKYDVDGVHFDDYFYPGTDFNDEESFARYGSGMSLEDWRRDNVNRLITDVQAVIRELNAELDRNVRWGISPGAIWMNGANDPLGVPTTRGQETFNALYADTRRWVTEEWVDYICPQIYWYIGFETANFEPILNWWTDLCEDYDVDLYIGHAAYREEQNDQPPNWRGEMVRQLEMVAGSGRVSGSVFFRFNSLRGSVGNSIRDFYAAKDGTPQRQPVMLLDTLTVGMPTEDITITATAKDAPGYSIAGTSDPDTPLYMNGEFIAKRTIEGFFYIYVPLETGENVFTFSQEGQEDFTRIITRNAPAPPSPTASPSPSPSPAPETTITEVTGPTYATITADAAWAYPQNTTSGGSGWMMTRGQRDRVVAEASNGYVKLSCGRWVNQDQVTLSTESQITENVLRNGIYRAGTDSDMVVWKSDVFSGVYAVFDGSVLTVSFGMHTEAPQLTLPNNLAGTIFSNVSSGIDNDTPYYAFTIRDDVKFEGQYVEYVGGELRLHLKKRKTTVSGNRPLTGVTIVLDPGHGGEEFGAIGPLGRELCEKHLNLINSLKLAERLRARGATVHLTRDSDVSVSLQQRVDLSRQTRPDLFISLHINSVAETTNAGNIRGFTVWYRNPGSISFSRTVLDFMHLVNPATNRSRGINQANYFVCRPSWAPSVILEASFIINMDDFVWLIDPVQQDRMADAAVEAILDYFS